MPEIVDTRRGPRVLVASAVLGVVLAGGAAWAPAAAAHDGLEHSVPAAGSEVPTAPTAVELTFAGRPVSASVEVLDGCGRAVPSTVTTDGAWVRSDLRAPAQADLRGAWTVRWTTVGGDGHPVEGELSFSVAGTPTCSVDTADEPEGTASTEATVDGSAAAQPVVAPTTSPVEARSSGDGSTPSGALLAGGVVVLVGVWLVGDRFRQQRPGGRGGTPS